MSLKKKGILSGSFMKINLLMLVFMLTAPQVFAEEIYVWSRAAWSEFMVQEFNKKMKSEGKDITAVNNLVGYDDYQTKLTAALSAGQQVDIANIDLVNVPHYSELQAFVDMTDFLKGKDYYEQLSKPMMHLGEWEGKQFAAPNAADVSALAYNKKLLKKHGFDGPPKNYADMITQCKAFADAGELYFSWPAKHGGGMIFTFQPWAWANGGEWVSKDGKKMMVNNPKTREVYAHFRQMMDIGCVPKNVSSMDWQENQDLWLNTKIAIVGTGNFMVKAIKEHLDKVDPGFTPFFSKDGSRISGFIGGDLIAVPVTTGNSEAAFEYVNFVLSKYGQVEVSTKSGSIPIRNDLYEGNPYLSENSMVFARAMQAGDCPKTVVWQELVDPWKITNERIFSGEDIDTVLKEQQAAMQKIIDDH